MDRDLDHPLPIDKSTKSLVASTRQKWTDTENGSKEIQEAENVREQELGGGKLKQLHD